MAWSEDQDPQDLTIREVITLQEMLISEEDDNYELGMGILESLLRSTWQEVEAVRNIIIGSFDLMRFTHIIAHDGFRWTNKQWDRRLHLTKLSHALGDLQWGRTSLDQIKEEYFDK